MYPFIYCFTSLVTSGHQKLWVTNSTIFHCPPYPSTGISWCSLMISTLNLLSLGIYIFSFLYMMPSTSFHFLSLNIFTLTHFISLTTFTILLSFTFDYFTFSNKSTSSIIISIFSILLTSSYSSFTNILFSLFLSIFTSQSGLLLRLSVFLILLPRIYFNIKSNLDRYNTHFTCLQFNFYAFIKYSRFL